MLYLGPVSIGRGAWDVVVLLNGAWRILCGQVPNMDYHSPLGPLTFLLVALGMKAAGPSAAAIPIGIVFLAGCLLPWAWNITSSRFPPVLAFVYVLFSGLLLIAPRPLGTDIRETSYAEFYNREGDVLIALIFVLVFLPRLARAGKKPISDGVSIGILLALIFYCKATYFVVAFATVLLGTALPWRCWKKHLSVALGFTGVCLTTRFMFHIPFFSYLHDIGTSGHVQAMTTRMQFLKYGASQNLPWIYFIFVSLLLWTYVDYASGSTLWSSAGLWLTAGWIIGAAVGLGAGNSGGVAENPLILMGGLIPLEQFRRRNQEQIKVASGLARLAYLAALMIILPHFCFKTLVTDAEAFAYASAWNLVKRPSFDASRTLHAGPLRDLRVRDGLTSIGPYWYTRDFPSKLNDGLDLLRKHLRAGDQVTTLGYTDPFSFAFGLKPCRDANSWWDLNMDFNRSYFPAPKEFLGSATLVMIPIYDLSYRAAAHETLDVMMGLYKDYLQQNFELVDASQAWMLYRRRSQSSGRGPNL